MVVGRPADIEAWHYKLPGAMPRENKEYGEHRSSAEGERTAAAGAHTRFGNGRAEYPIRHLASRLGSDHDNRSATRTLRDDVRAMRAPGWVLRRRADEERDSDSPEDDCGRPCGDARRPELHPAGEGRAGVA